MEKTVFESQMAHLAHVKGLPEAAAEFQRDLPEYLRADPDDLDKAFTRMRRPGHAMDQPSIAEAIVQETGFPSLIIQNGTFHPPRNPMWQGPIEGNRATIQAAISSVGRVDIKIGASSTWIGTAWRIDEDVFITNAHVAAFFAEVTRSGFGIQPGKAVFVDMAEEHQHHREIEEFVAGIISVEPIDRIDMALLRMERRVMENVGDPIALDLTGGTPDHVAVIGYPGNGEQHNPGAAIHNYFQGIYGVKRLAPGMVMNADISDTVFSHNCTTLGGNSGSPVIDVASGRAIGLHYSGQFLVRNQAVKATAVADVMRRRNVAVGGVDGGGAGENEDAEGDAAQAENTDFADRDGYRADFIGTGDLFVPMPAPNIYQASKMAQTEAGETVLNYRHFSVIMNKNRRLAFVAAANIDGDELRRPRRRNSFKLDPRLRREDQIGNTLYRNNPLDRGHLIRRLDPTWGSKADANQANIDSMFYTNIAPQHKDLNQRIWLRLEEHILGKTDDADARVSVFVGPIFDETDAPEPPSNVKVPQAYWKVIASVARVRRGRSRRRVLQAQAFVLSQAHLVARDQRELVFGAGFEEFQITIAELERVTGLDFDVLRDADTFGISPEMAGEARMRLETLGLPFAVSGDAIKRLESLEDIDMGDM